MKSSNDFLEEKYSGKLVGISIIGVSFVAFILLLTLFLNQKQMNAAETAKLEKESLEAEAQETINEQSTLTSDDLDFWGMYDYKEEEEREVQARRRVEEMLKEEREKAEKEALEKEREELSESLKKKESEENKTALTEENDSKIDDETETIQEEDYASNEKYTEITKEDGTKEWVEILDTIPQNNYNFDANLAYSDPQMKYFTDGKQTSSFGIDVSAMQGEIDWKKVKDAGVDFAMIRVGARGYQSGTVSVDNRFAQNIEGAISQGIKVGVYFYSQATTSAEAIEEANFVVGAINHYPISYPIVYDTERVENDAARTDNLTNAQRTQFALDFCNTVKNWGYKPMIYAQKEWLLKRHDLELLNGIDIWYAEVADKPDYPYQFVMWQYSQTGKIDGINGDVDLNIGFVDYEKR